MPRAPRNPSAFHVAGKQHHGWQWRAISASPWASAPTTAEATSPRIRRARQRRECCRAPRLSACTLARSDGESVRLRRLGNALRRLLLPPTAGRVFTVEQQIWSAAPIRLHPRRRPVQLRAAQLLPASRRALQPGASGTTSSASSADVYTELMFTDYARSPRSRRRATSSTRPRSIATTRCCPLSRSATIGRCRGTSCACDRADIGRRNVEGGRRERTNLKNSSLRAVVGMRGAIVAGGNSDESFSSRVDMRKPTLAT